MEHLKHDEYVVTAFAQPASGPGWADRPVVVIIGKQGTKKMRTEYIQPDDQSAAMLTLYGVSAVVSEQMKKTASRVLK